MDKESFETLITRGDAAKAKHQWGDAADAYRKALAIKPDDALALYNLGIALRSSGDLDGAIEAYRKAIVIKPNYVEAWHNLGIILGEDEPLFSGWDDKTKRKEGKV